MYIRYNATWESKVVNLTVDRKQVLKNELYAKDNYVTDTRIQ